MDNAFGLKGFEDKSESDVVDDVLEPARSFSLHNHIANISALRNCSRIERRILTRFPGNYEVPLLDLAVLF